MPDARARRPPPPGERTPSNSRAPFTRRNCFEIRDPADGATRSGMFVVGSRFNHDCFPNVHRTWLPEEGVEVYHATRDVSEGGELCGEYCPTYRDTPARRAALRRYGFECACATCARADPASDTRKRAFEATYRALYSAPPESAAAVDAIRRLLAIADAEFDSPAMNRRVLHDGVIVALKRGDVGLAAKWMRDLYHAQRLSAGDGATTRRFAEYCDDVRAFRPAD